MMTKSGYQWTLSIPQHDELGPGLLRKLLKQAHFHHLLQPAMREHTWTALSVYSDAGHRKSFLFLSVSIMPLSASIRVKNISFLCALASKLRPYKIINIFIAFFRPIYNI
ncbi:MAG: hypothetical protein C0392_00030 [Syntrophus sp. (in: bacteria)]|nr:hypothetical protein [Syntrophus sp. (in: bacteria)]